MNWTPWSKQRKFVKSMGQSKKFRPELLQFEERIVPDARLFLTGPGGVTAGVGNTFGSTTPIELRLTTDSDFGITSYNFGVEFDPAVFSISNYQEVDFGLSPIANINNSTGQLVVSSFEPNPSMIETVAAGQEHVLATFDLTVNGTTPVDRVLDLRDTITNNVGTATTQINAMAIPLNPGPQNNDSTATSSPDSNDLVFSAEQPSGRMFLEPNTTAAVGTTIPSFSVFFTPDNDFELTSYNIQISYDTDDLLATDGGAGADTAADFTQATNVAGQPGGISISAFRSGNPFFVTAGNTIELATIEFQVNTAPQNDPTIINLRDSITFQGVGTAATLVNAGVVDLDPDPDNVAGDSLDGVIDFIVPINVAPANLFGDGGSLVDDTAVNQAPVQQALFDSGPITFDSGTDTAFYINDPDLTGTQNEARVTLRVENVTEPGQPAGTLSLNAAAIGDLDFSAPGFGDGTDDAELSFTGTQDEINAALDGMTFNPAAGFAGRAQIVITTDDQGNTGGGGSLSKTDRLDVDIVRLFIDEIHYAAPNNASGGDSPLEYVEIRSSVPNFTLPIGTQLFSIQSKKSVPTTGKISSIFSLGGATTGANGRLVIEEAGGTPNPYSTAGLVDSNATSIQSSGGYYGGNGFQNLTSPVTFTSNTGLGGFPQFSNEIPDGSTNPLPGLDNDAITFLLINGSQLALGADLDTNDDGTLESGFTSSWEVQDGITVGGYSGGGYYGGSPVGFNYASNGPDLNGLSVTTSGPNGGAYVARLNDSSGDTLSDWVVAETTTFLVPGDVSSLSLGTVLGPNSNLTGRVFTNSIGQTNNYFAEVVDIVTNRAETDAGLAAQRSVITSFDVFFSESVTVAPGAFSLTGPTGNPVTINVNAVAGSNNTIYRVDFAGGVDVAGLFGGATVGGFNNFLAVDGYYSLDIDSTLVTDNSGAFLDGDGDNDALDLDDFAGQIFRLYGDSDGDGGVGGTDRNEFIDSFQGNPGSLDYLVFDFDNDGIKDGLGSGQDADEFFAQIGIDLDDDPNAIPGFDPVAEQF